MTTDEQAAGPSESAVTVIIAFAANLAIAVAKTVAAVLTGSASMVAESAHSWADAGNEIFLYIADRRSRKPADERHPLGFGRNAYVWSMFAAVGVFTVGAVLSVQHGISELTAEGRADDVLVSYVVLGVSLVLESISFLRSLRQLRGNAAKQGRDVLEFALHTSDPTVRAVFFEDAAAIVGIVIAGVGILLHQRTGSGVWDASGSIAIGVLLGVVAIILIRQNHRFLIGEAVEPATRSSALAVLLSHEQVTRVSYLHLEFVGPGRVFLVAAVDLEGDSPEHSVAIRLREIDRELESRPEIARAILTLTAPGDPDATA